ncbi:2-dehydropantoate 2-reductase [Candidatus Desulfarcum epimagneticum]|uniref:2-dehydropantoate 2-reductase n=1 Tax=uncultured Desulfobacteraceae bacterium TaxID=218296 RepID=A0A484HHS5_9BACT|nr:2-dehydropantoate 2-reductase [uncultured Desulfobacteraceae bacterium]
MKEETGFCPQSFAVIGAGPVGCIVAAFLAKGGMDVTLCDVVPELIENAAGPGIVIEGSESLQAPVTRTCSGVDELADIKPDVIFVTAKANALPLIASSLEAFVGDGMHVVSWQNGIDTELELSRVLGKKPVMRAVVNYGCGLKGPCHVVMPFHHPPHYIQELDPDARDAAAGIAKVLSDCGLTTERTDRIVSEVWRKSVMNASMNPVCAVTGLPMARAMGDPIVFQIVDSLLKECVAIARANEIDLGWDYYERAVEYMKNAGNHKPSMLMDIEAERRTEIDFINKKFVEYGRRANVDAPFNLTLMSLVKGLESSVA